jgi:hypothetical protein
MPTPRLPNTHTAASLQIQNVPPERLKPFKKNPRDHSKAHVAEVARSIGAFGMNVPILCDESYEIIAGHATLLACKLLKMTKVPVICLGHLTEAEKVAFRIAHNRLCEKGKWNAELLVANFEILYEQDLSFEFEDTGFSTGEIDVMRIGGKEAVKQAADAARLMTEVVELPDAEKKPVSRSFDRFKIGHHIIVNGDARDRRAYELALGQAKADLGLCDAPYGCAIAGHASGSGRVKHEDFIEGCNLSPDELRELIGGASALQAAFSKPGAYNVQFTDWRAMFDMQMANREIYAELKHICIWKKTNGGMGSLWRGAWEGILVYRVAGGKPINNVMLGVNGRNRTDVFEYAGVNTFKAGRMEELEAHPTCKPVPLLADLILDITPINGIVLDVFLGSGSTILAAHETERRGVGIELDSKFVDVAIRRIEKRVGQPAIHQSGKTFDELAAERAQEDKEASDGRV